MNYAEMAAYAGATVVRACIYGSLFILIVWAVCRFVPRLTDSARCGLWWLASSKLLLGLVLSGSVAVPLLPSRTPRAMAGVLTANQPASQNTAVNFGRPHTRPALNSNAPPISPSEVSVTAEKHLRLPDPATVLIWIWALVIVFRLGYLCRSLIVLRQCIARSRPLQDLGLLRTAQEVAHDFRLVRLPRLCVSDTVTDPLLCGMFRKVILFSASDIANLSTDEFRMVFAHECAHLRRGDLWLSLFPALTQIIYWFFPPAWLVCSEFEATRESACDTEALKNLDAEPGVYGRLLLKLSSRPERLDPLSLSGALGVSSHLQLLRRRIKMLQFNSARSRPLAGVVLISVCGIVGLIPWRVVAAVADETSLRRPSLRQSSADLQGHDLEETPVEPRNLDFSDGMSGWTKVESVNDMPVDTGDSEFAAEIEPNGPRPGEAALSVECKATAPKRGAVVTQKIRTNEFRGKRYRFSALVKTVNTKAAAGIWIREDTSHGQRAWNAFSKPILGTNDWKRYDYVIDVFPNSTSLDFGVMLEGHGKVEVTDFKFEAVDPSIPVSDPNFDSILPEIPTNLDFSHGLRGWEESTHDGDEPYFASGLDSSMKHSGVPAPYLACNSDQKGVYGVLTQWIDATPYRGKRVRFSGSVKTSGIREYGGLMWCLNGAAEFDSYYDMRKRPNKGDHDWSHIEYVADVPSDRVSFTIGINLQGRGTVWVDALKFEIVGTNVPLTPLYHTETGSSAAPQNLDFSHGLAHWSKGASGADSPNPYYEVGFDRNVKHGESPAAFVKSSVPDPQGYGVLRQDIAAQPLQGKRIRFSAYLKAKEIKKHSGLLLAILSASGSKMWSMSKRPILGNSDWVRCEYVADIPDDATLIMFGASIQGRGTVYATDFKFEAVGKDVPLTPSDKTL